MRKVTLFFGIILLSGGLFAQPHIQVIEDATDVHFIQHSVIQPKPGLYVVAGTVTPGPISGNSDILVLATDNPGNILWARYVDYGQDEFVGSLMDDANQDIVLTGYTGQNNTGNKNLIVVKLDANGNYINDVVITDPGLGYAMYGLDIEQTNSGNYIVVGTAVNLPTSNSIKYSFALQLAPGLNSIIWGRISQNTGVQPVFNSVSHILKIANHPSYGECYLVTGSETDPNGNQMAGNLLITPTGMAIWPIAYNGLNAATFSYKAVMTLYKNSSNEFYVLCLGDKTQPSITVLDGNNGTIKSSWTMVNGKSNLINGMVWESPTQNTIVLSGYVIAPPSPYNGNPVLFSVDITTSVPTIQWGYRYNPTFSATNLNAIPFDYMVRPLHNVSGYFNQLYYQPKTLVQSNDRNWSGYEFSAPIENGNFFDLNFLNTDNGGSIDSECLNIETYEIQEAELKTYTNFSLPFYTFNILGSQVNVVSAELINFLTCAPKRSQKPTINSDSQKEMGGIQIRAYPNPVKDYLFLSGLSNMQGTAKIILYDITGRKILSRFHEKNLDETQLNVSNLQKGIYILQVTWFDKIIYQKQVIKR